MQRVLVRPVGVLGHRGLMGELGAADVARWMHEQVTERGELRQYEVIRMIRGQVGDDETLLKLNTLGRGHRLTEAVLKAFRALNEKTVVYWWRAETWRLRTETDKPGRRQG